MTIGANIESKEITLGTVLRTFNRAVGATFQVLDNGVYRIVKLRPSGVASRARRFGMTYTFTPSAYDDPSDAPSGRLTVSVNVDASMGSVVNTAELAATVKEAVSLLAQDTVLDSLVAGATE